MGHPEPTKDYTEELTEDQREIEELKAKLNLAIENLRKAADRAVESTLDVQRIFNYESRTKNNRDTRSSGV